MSSNEAVDPVGTLAERFRQAIVSAFPDLSDADPLIAPTRNPDVGDYQCNAAMGLGRRLGRPPRDVALAIVRHVDLGDLAEPLTEQSVAGPGFINIRLRATTIVRLLEALAAGDLGVPKPSTPHTVVVDLCGVNLAKQMHVGHLRSTIIGDCLARLMDRLGHRVIRQNHVGDWGLPIAMVVARVQQEAARGRDPATLTLDDLDTLYREAQRACQADESGLAAVRRFGLGPKAAAELEEQVAGAHEAMAQARRTLLLLQAREPQTIALWQRIARITLDECLDIARQLNAVVLPEHTAGESSYADELPALVEDLLARGIAEVHEGAVIVRLDDEGIPEPCLIRKRDGGFLYATTDLAAIRRRVQQLGADRVIYAVDARQSLHFRQVFAVARRAGYDRRPGTDRPASLEHAAFGTVLGEDGRPLRTRAGENVRLADLIREALDRARRVVVEKNPALPPDDQNRIARAVALAALRYADLASDRARDYVFSYDRMLAFEGNTGPYLLYAAVRVRRILDNASAQGLGDGTRGELCLAHTAERLLGLALVRYPHVLAAAADALEPHRICQYLYDLAGAFTAFYDACHVLQAPDAATRASRLRLCRITAAVMEDALGVLGIPVLERM